MKAVARRLQTAMGTRDSHLYRYQVWSWKSLNNQQIWCQPWKYWCKVNHQQQLSLFDTYNRQGNDGKKDKILKYKNCLLQNMKTDGSMKFTLAKTNFGIVTQNQSERYVPREIGIWWSVVRSILQSSYRGDFWWVRSRRIFTKDLQKCSDRISH